MSWFRRAKPEPAPEPPPLREFWCQPCGAMTVHRSLDPIFSDANIAYNTECTVCKVVKHNVWEATLLRAMANASRANADIG